MKYNGNDIFVQTIKGTYGEKGVLWLSQLSTIIEKCTVLWNLTHLKPYPSLTYNYVLKGMRGAVPIVLKLRCDYNELAMEVATLRAFQVDISVKVLEYNLSLGALLLERLIPGDTLESLFPYDDERATYIAASLIHVIHQSSVIGTLPLPLLNQILPDLHTDYKALEPFIKYARKVRKQLIEKPDSSVLLHGDFHQGNILQANHEWKVIDPQGIIGNPLYDLGVYIRNPLKALIAQSHAKGIIVNRIKTFSTLLGYDQQSLFDWTYFQSLSSAYWSLQDGLDINNHVKFLHLWNELL